MTAFKRAIFATAVPAVTAAMMQPAIAAQGGGETETDRTFGGPDGVSSQVAETYEDKDASFDADTLERGMSPYRAWKQWLKNEREFAIGFNAYELYFRRWICFP